MQTIKNNVLIIILALFSLQVYAQEFPEKSNRIVNDYSNFLSVDERNALEQKLVNFSNQTSTQIAIAIVPNLQGYDASSYAFELGERWGIGQKGKNNGILILVKPKTSNSKGEIFIATGYGVEGAVPDAIAKRIVDNEVLPNFRQGQYYKGLDQAVNTIISLTKGEFTADEYRERTSGNVSSAIPMIIIFLLIILFSVMGRVRRARHYAVGHNLPFWIALGMLSSTGRSHGGSFGNFSSGSGSFGGFSGGGGFGGFGGGSFGGGGAGGSW
ncbi:MAG: TPM domain-containing protein [Bacteroidota bacterium]|nr:TPM domain-containing protein [Bacteroidota bacterium]